VSVTNLPGNSTVLKELSLTPRNKTGVETSTELTQLLLNKPVTEWAQVLNSLDLPDGKEYYITFAAILATFSSTIFPWFAVEMFFKEVVPIALTPKDAAFVLNDYLPALHTATENISITKEEKSEIGHVFLSMMIKLFYAFSW